MPTLHAPLRYAAALGIVAIALALQAAVWEHVAPRAYLFVYPALFFACLVGGLRPGLAATGLAGVGVAWLFLPPDGPAIGQPKEQVAVLGFGVMGAVFSLTGELVRTHFARQHEVRAALEDALATRDEFLSIASHEIRTPLAALRLQLELAARRLAVDPTPHPATPAVRQALGQVDRLTRLSRDLLDATRAQRGRLDLVRGPVDATALVTELAGRLAPELEAAGCPLTVRAEPGLHGEWDRVRVEQVLVNLLTNAARHAAGAPVEVHARRDGEHVCLEVRDQGAGIAPAVRERLFERFVGRREGSARGGLGLGLYIVRSIVEAHGGRVGVASEPGAGATFSVHLPVAPPA